VADKVGKCGNMRLLGLDPVVRRIKEGGNVAHCGKAVCPCCLPYHDGLRIVVLKKVMTSIVEI
jgi:hypothetical protein